MNHQVDGKKVWEYIAVVHNEIRYTVYKVYINNNDDNSNINDAKNDIVYIHTYTNFISHSVRMHHIMYGYSSFHIYICKYSNLT